MQSVPDDVRKRLLEKPRFELAVKGVDYSDWEDVTSSGLAGQYSALANTHTIFFVAIEISGTMNQLAVDLVSEIGRRISSVTGRPRSSFNGFL